MKDLMQFYRHSAVRPASILLVQLAKKGVLKECDVEILGTNFDAIERAEDRELFKELCESLGEPVLPS